MRAILPALLVCCGAALAAPLPAHAGGNETFGPMTVSVPSEWRKRTEPDGAIAFATGEAGAPGAAASSSSLASSSSNARDANDVPIVESHVHIQIQPGSFTSSVLTDHVLFFENGIVVRTGVIDGPRECYAALPVANLATLPFNYGRWREDKATRAIRVDWQEGPAWHLERENEEKLSLNGKRLLKLRPVDGAKFDGAYVYRSGNDLSALGFTADGKFEALNLTESMTCSGAAIASGSGSYEVRKWTLILRFSNGATTMLPLTIRNEENLQNVRKFSVKHFDFAPAS